MSAEPRFQSSAATKRSSGQVSTLPPLAPKDNEPTIYAWKSTHGLPATPRSARTLSRKLQDLLKKKKSIGENLTGTFEGTPNKFEAKNWKQLTDKELQKLTSIQRSRYLAYEAPPKDIQEKRKETLKRVRTTLIAEKECEKGLPLETMIEYEWDSGLVGHLKAAEARQRLKRLKMIYLQEKEDELAHLIASQPSSIEAVRLKCFLQPLPFQTRLSPLLSRHEQERCDKILEDINCSSINRTL